MQIWEIFLLGAALAADAFAAGMTDGMAEPKMKWGKLLSIAGVFGFMQFLMPVLGYFFGGIFTVFVEKIAPWLSFALLLLIGGKAVVSFFVGIAKKRKGEEAVPAPAGIGEILLQGVATSLDALAVGVTLLAVETAEGLPMHAALCALIIGGVTFLLVVPALLIGKKAGDKFADKAELIGGLVLIGIGLKILLEGIL